MNIPAHHHIVISILTVMVPTAAAVGQPGGLQTEHEPGGLQTEHAMELLPGDILVNDEGPTCPPGGPIFLVTAADAEVVAQGVPLEKPRGSVIDAEGALIVADGRAGLLEVDPESGVAVLIAQGPPFSPRDVTIDGDGLYVVVDWPDPLVFPGESPALWSVTPAGETSLIAAGSPLRGPHGLDQDEAGDFIVADSLAGIIRVTLDGQMTLVLDSNSSAELERASDVRVNAAGNYVVADLHEAVVEVTPDGVPSDLYRGPPLSPYDPAQRIGGPRGVVIDSSGDYILVDEASRAVLRISEAGEIDEIFSGDPLCLPADLTLVPDLIFADGFETGTTGAWSSTSK